jgi:hypothetical protein
VTGEKKARFCSKHKEHGMVDVINRTCEKCDIKPSFNTFGSIRARFCAQHKEDGMVDVRNRRCENCDTVPVFNTPGMRNGRFCAQHKEDGMIDVLTPKCEKCLTKPVFNLPGSKRGRFCAQHKEDGMIDVVSKTCEMCATASVFNTPGSKRGRFCVLHKEDGMIDVRTPKCEKCDAHPCFNAPGTKRARFCSRHKETDMVDVSNKKCEKCNSNPSFNIPGSKYGRFCVQHKEACMVDVHSIMCHCGVRANFGLLGQRPSACAQHRTKGMLFGPRRRCVSCRSLGVFDKDGMRFCDAHVVQPATNLGLATCSICGLDDILTNNVCDTCDPTVVQVRRKFKELRVKDVLVANQLQYVHDRMLESFECGLERPDFQFDCGTHWVYLEVDEHQHQQYPCECEQARMINLVHQRGMKVTFIRYNPDEYEPGRGKALPLKKREDVLIKCLKGAIRNAPTSFAEVVYLFYDGCGAMADKCVLIE